MRNTVPHTPTPAEPDDGHQPRDHAVMCIWHDRPTYRRDGCCDLCLDGEAS